MKYHVITGHDENYRELAMLTEPGKEVWAARHSYTFNVWSLQSVAWHPSWLKIPNLMKLLNNSDASTSGDWVFWTDTDAMLMNLNGALEDITQVLYPNTSFVISEDAIGINAGHFLIRDDMWSRAFLHDVWALREKHKNSPYWEQSAMMELFEDPCYYEGHVQVVPKRSFNSYPDDYQPGDLMLHVPGIKGAPLMHFMRNAARGSILTELFEPTARALAVNPKQPRLFSKQCGVE